MAGSRQGFTIRPAESADESRFLDMFARLVTTGPEPCAPDAPAHVWRQVMADDGPMRMLIACDPEGVPVGFALWVTFPYSWSARPIAYLLDVFVEERARRLGLGTALIEEAASIGRREGWMKMYWMTQEDNARARAVYDRIAARSALVRYDMYLNPY
jgi:GNAT superfamily N-acetyltransferase